MWSRKKLVMLLLPIISVGRSALPLKRVRDRIRIERAADVEASLLTAFPSSPRHFYCFTTEKIYFEG